MTILSGQTIRKLGVFTPFCERSKFEGRSYGLGPAGYDIRIAETMWVWPLWGRLASTVEHFDMPTNVLGRVADKSTNARKFLTVQNTVIEPGWKGYLTLELTRHLPWPIRIKKGTPIAQILLEFTDEHVEKPYDGKYQNQKAGPQKAIHEK